MPAHATVIGAGPVGQTTALLLADWGLDVTLVDRLARREAVGSKSICQQRDVLDIWARLGAHAITTEGLTWTTARTFHRDRELHSWSFAPVDGTPPFVNISQARTEAILDELIAANSRITQLWGREATAITQPTRDPAHSHAGAQTPSRTGDDAVGHSRVHVSDLAHDASHGHAPGRTDGQSLGGTVDQLSGRIGGQARDPARGPATVPVDDRDAAAVVVRFADGSRIYTSYVVVCTGARDSLRDGLGIAFDGTTHPDRFLICDIAAHLPGRRHERHFHFDPAANPGRQILIHPCPDDTYRIDWQVAPDYRSDLDDLDSRIRAVIGDTPYTLLWSTVYRFHSRVAARMSAGRVLLAGDAAHLFAPFGARGLNSGIADAENAAWKIAAHAHGWAGESILDTYHTERHAAAVENQQVVDATMDFLAPRTGAGRAHRRARLEAAATDPGRAAAIDSGRFAEPYWYDHSALTTPAPHRAVTIRPPKGQVPPPAPGTICPDTALPDGTALRQHLRGHFGLISRHAHPGFGALTDAPTRVVNLDAVDPSGHIAAIIGLRDDETWITRPDGHLAAILTDATDRDIADALRRTQCRG